MRPEGRSYGGQESGHPLAGSGRVCCDSYNQSAATQCLKGKMFGFLKNLLQRKPAETPIEPETQSLEQFEAPQSASAQPAARVAPQRGGTMQQPGQGYGARPVAQARPKGLEIPLQTILSVLPLELQPRVLYTDVGEMAVNVPLEKILAQLSSGAVRISFGELRQAASGIFSPENDRDRVMVTLPLQEILNRLNPALITRRRVQRHVEVPAEISSPFD